MTTITIRQPIYRSGAQQRAMARRLIAGAQQPAPHVLAATLECSDYDRSVTVVACKSRKLQQRAGVALVPGQLYWMVRSPKFVSRWYLVTRNVRSQSWMTSSRDEQASTYCIDQVQAFIAARRAA